MSDPLELSLIEIRDEIAKGAVSSLQVTEAVADSIAKRGKSLNCFVDDECEQAMEQARIADQTRPKSGRLPQLYGVPLAHKDLFYRRGRVSACGSRIRSDYHPRDTSTALARLEAAGALNVGRLHMVEFAFGPTGHNQHLGPCRNPWNTDHITGGSSSGSAAAVAGRLVFGALGTDTGGSIRLPAAMCGLAGLKPTYGRVSRFGVMPLSASLDHVGPLCKTVADCALMMSVIAGHDPQDPTSSTQPVPDYTASLGNNVKGLRIGIPSNFFTEGLSDEVKTAIATSLDVLKSCGATIQPISFPDPALLRDLCRVIITSEALSFHEKWLASQPERYSNSVRGRLETGILIPASRYVTALRMRAALLDRVKAEVFTSVDVVHTPIYSESVPTIAEADPDIDSELKVIGKLPQRTQPINYLGLPALAVPCGFSGNGLPIGFQLIGKPFDEETLLNLGHIFQQETDWHRRRPVL